MGKDISALPDHLTLEGELFDFDNVNVTTNLNGNLLDKAKVGVTLGGEYTNTIRGELFDKIKATITATLGGEFTNRLTGDLLEKMAANLAATFIWTEIPIIKFRVPHDYTFGFRFFGIEFFSMRFRGESKAVTAKNPAGAVGGTDV